MPQEINQGKGSLISHVLNFLQSKTGGSEGNSRKWYSAGLLKIPSQPKTALKIWLSRQMQSPAELQRTAAADLTRFYTSEHSRDSSIIKGKQMIFF